MDISKIKIGSTTYDIKDSVARSAMTNGTHFIGKLVTDSSVNGAASSITDGDAPSIIETTLGVYTKGTASDGQTQLAAGDIVLYGTSGSNASAPKEFIWDGGKFQELGSTGSLKDLAFKDNASGTFTPAGSNSASAVSFEGGQSGTFVTGFNDDAVAPTFTEGQFTPASIQSGFVSAGSAASYSHSGFDGGSLGDATTGNFATEGVTVAYTAASETLTFDTAGTSAAVTAQGAFTPATYGTDTFTPNTPTAIDTTKFSGGSKAADTFTAGSAATPTTGSAITNIGTGTAAAQVFTGSEVNVTVS